MSSIYVDTSHSDDSRRERLYAGDLFVYSHSPSAMKLADLGRAMIEDAFHGHDPRKLHDSMPVEECVAILAKLKPSFIHHPEAKRLIPSMLSELGCDLDKMYFDVPRMRSAFPTDYLTSGIAYAFHPHRDTWYSAPFCQINWWLPIYDTVPENCMAFHPKYWDRPVRNGSRDYNYYRWNKESRGSAAQHIKTDTRVQPHAEEELEMKPDIRIAAKTGQVIVFSAAQMHSTVENTAGAARFSVDFRTVHVDDVWARRGARNLDSECTGTTMHDYLRASDLSHLPAEAIALYEDGTELAEHLVYQPGAAAGVMA
jgi:hypothetical protein